MRRNLILAITLFVSTIAFAAPQRQLLHDNWQFKQQRGTNWYNATVPGVVHTDLMANGVIEDPFFRLNERGVQWVDKEDWEYVTTFTADKDILSKESIELVFEGLDTYADVYLNNELLLSADNMFRRWRIDVKKHLREGENKLRVYFHSVVKIDMPKWEALPFQYYRWNDQSENGGLLKRKISVFCRKSGYHYGWDWGPRLVTSGIWRPVYLEAWDSLRISDIFYNQKSVTEERAEIDVEFEILSQKSTSATLSVIDENSGKVVTTKEVALVKGENRIVAPMIIAKPELWWSNGLGEAHRYSFKAEVAVNGKAVDHKHHNIAVRSLRVIREEDKDGRSFYFELNGKRVFAKGANYIPCDSFLTRVTDEVYEKTIADAVAVHMNMLRVWGGGIYENEKFYEECEKNGIMVWQDFMFGCALYPVEGAMIENIRQEAIDNIKRLRNYGCIALWCGNNECYDTLMACKHSYEKKGIDMKYYDIQKAQFDFQYYELLPEVCAKYDPMRYYHPMSPWAAKDVKSSDAKNMGDFHYWGVWGNRHPIDNYNTTRTRFMSEFGFQSFPELSTIKRYAPDQKDWSIYSEVMMSHQRGGKSANSKINDYMKQEYWEQPDFEKFIYMGQVMQGDVIKIAVEAHRRDMPFCQGSLFWQHNDCWPVASWASRDYYGRWKAQHYFARKYFDKYLLSAYNRDGRLRVFVASDSQINSKAKFEVKVMTLTGEVVTQYSKKVTIPANTSTILYNEATEVVLNGRKAEDLVIVSSLLVDGKVYTNNNYFVKQGALNFPKATIKTAVAKCDGGVEVTLSTDNFARAVYMAIDDVDNFFEDNYIDLLPNTSHKVKVKTSLSVEEFKRQLKIEHLGNCK